MKRAFVFISVVFSFTARCQDTARLKHIESLVQLINTSTYNTQRDTLVNDQSQLGLSMITYLTIVTDGNELKKYVNNVHATTQENGVAKELITTSTFFFHGNKLIKVEESAIKDDRKIEMLWYYADDKPVFYTMKSEKAQERAEMLLTIANSMLKKMGFK